MAGLNIADVVRVDVNMTPRAVPVRNFGALLIAGNSAVIDTNERIREYTTLDGVAADFGTTAPEFMAANLFFSQKPQPSTLYVGRFAQTPSSAVLHGRIFTAIQQAQLLISLNAITNGTFEIDIDGTTRTVSASPAVLNGGIVPPFQQAALFTTLNALTDGAFSITVDGTAVDTGEIDFTAAVDLTEIGEMVDTALGTAADCEWNSISGQFVVVSGTTGIASAITYAAAPATGTDISADLRLTSASGAFPPVNGTAGLDFSNVTNLNGAASIISAATFGATCWWDGRRFHIASLHNGPTSTLSYARSTGIGQDISTLTGLSQTGGASEPVDGIAAETPLAGVQRLRRIPTWYGLTFALTTELTTPEHLEVAGFIEGCSPISIYGYTTQDTDVLDGASITDVCSQMMDEAFQRTFGQYSSSSPFAVASMYGRAFTVDFQSNNSMITLKFKVQPGVLSEELDENEAAALRAKNCNVFVRYANDVAIIQDGVMANGFYFDEIHGCDWQANQIQTDIFNALYTSPNKIPQTDGGVHQLVTTVTNSLQVGVNNGLIAPGVWNAPGFGMLDEGQVLPTGFYVYAPLIATQPQSVREQRIAPTIQCAIKLAGAVHFAGVVVNVNR